MKKSLKKTSWKAWIWFLGIYSASIGALLLMSWGLRGFWHIVFMH